MQGPCRCRLKAVACSGCICCINVALTLLPWHQFNTAESTHDLLLELTHKFDLIILGEGDKHTNKHEKRKIEEQKKAHTKPRYFLLPSFCQL